MLDPAFPSATGIAGAVRSGERSAVEITRQALEKAGTRGRDLNAFITLCENKALARAEAVDAAVKKRGGEALPLAGVPIAVKDNICYRDYPTTCASRILDGFVPPYNATVIDRLEAAGAVIIGKTNMDEFAMGSSSETSFYGPVKHPADPTLVPGGSSGGSAAAVASGIVPLALGSDTGGSVRQPAAFCGVLGLKPTWGAVSRSGLVAFASSTDQVGPFARKAEDLALLYRVIAGRDPLDATSVAFTHPDYPTLLAPDRPLTIGIPEEFFSGGLDPEIDGWTKRAVHDLLEIGHQVREVALPLTRHAVAAYYIIANAEASSNLARFDGVRYGHRADDAATPDELYARTRAEGFGREVKRRIMLGTYVLSSGYYDRYYRKAVLVRQRIRQEFADVFKQVDALITPTTPTAAFKAGEKLDDPMAMYLSDVYTVSASLAGIPAVSVPFGQTSGGLPVGLQFMADRFCEQTLFQLAFTLEKLS